MEAPHRSLSSLPPPSRLTREDDPAHAPQSEVEDQGQQSPAHHTAQHNLRRATRLREQQDRHLRLVADAIPALISYVGADRRYRFANAAYEAWIGKPCNEIIGCGMEEVLGEAYAQAQPHLDAALAGQQVSFESTMHYGGGDKHVLAIYTPDKAHDGKVRGVSILVMDISGRHAAEAAVREREQQLRLITDALPVFIAQIDPEYRLRFVNRAYAERFGTRPQEVIGKRIPDLIGDISFARVRQVFDTALRGTPQEHEIAVHAPDGGERQLHIMAVPETDADTGKVQGAVAAISDITELRRAEERLRRREQEFMTLVEHSPDIISRMDSQMRHLYVNPAITALAPIEPALWLGKTKAELGLPESVVRAWDNAARAAFTQGTEQRLDFDHPFDGEMRYFSGRVIPEKDQYGQIESVIGIAYDVTQRARVQKERDELLARERTARIQAETAARARDEFLAIVSHELRAPLNGIQSWAHVLENYVQDATSAPLAQRALQGIKTGVGQQVRLIEDLLDVTRMMSGKLRLVKQPLALLPVLQSAVESVRNMATARHISINCHYRITSEQIDGDADRVQQIFWNLLSNAIKFTHEEGSVWLSAERVGQELQVAIHDDGVGISPEFLPRLFNRFSQEDTSSTRDHSGLGLGLFIVRHLTELHSGTVVAESPGEGRGATFTVRFPLRVTLDTYLSDSSLFSPSDWRMPLPALRGLRVLVIDDQEEARESLKVVLGNAGARVHTAAAAQEVLQWLAALGPDSLPQVLVCDIAMPGEDGYAVLRKLREWTAADGTRPLQRLPALALTAFAQREDRIKALTAGFQMHITKPVSPEELIVVLDTMGRRE